jgi:hypothetical protein
VTGNEPRICIKEDSTPWTLFLFVIIDCVMDRACSKHERVEKPMQHFGWDT